MLSESDFDRLFNGAGGDGASAGNGRASGGGAEEGGEYCPWEDAGGEGWKDPYDIDSAQLAEALIGAYEEDCYNSCIALANKVLWDIIMSVLRPGREGMAELLRSIAQRASQAVVSQYQEMEGEQIPEAEHEQYTQAANRAYNRFAAAYSDSVIVNKMLAEYRRQFINNINKGG